MRGHAGDWLIEFEIVGELGAFGFLAFHERGAQLASAPNLLADRTHNRGRFRHAFDQDAARAFKGGLGTFNAFVCGRYFSASATGSSDGLASRRSASGSSPASLPLTPLSGAWAVGRIKIFKFDFGRCSTDLPFQVRRQLALLADRAEHDLAAVIEDREVFETLGERAKLRVVETARALFPVARDEGMEAPSSISWMVAATWPSPTPSSLAMMRAIWATTIGSLPDILQTSSRSFSGQCGRNAMCSRCACHGCGAAMVSEWLCATDLHRIGGGYSGVQNACFFVVTVTSPI